MRVTGVDACRRGWVAVSLQAAGSLVAVRTDASLAALLGPTLGPDAATVIGTDPDAATVIGTDPDAATVIGTDPDAATVIGTDPDAATVIGIDMPLGLLETGWREADRVARGLLGPRRSSVFAIPPRAVWAEASYPAANQRCRELTGRGFSAQAWGLRTKLLEANQCRETSGHLLYEVHPELAFGVMAGAPLAYSKHTVPGRALRRRLLAQAGIEIPAGTPAALLGDILDAAAVAWSARRIVTGQAVIIPGEPQRDRQGREITIRF